MKKLEVRCISVEYQTKRTRQPLLALDQISFEVEEGQFVAILGPSGCGKTTLLNVIGGLQSATGGVVSINGKEIRGPARNCSMVFQSPALLPWRTILKNVVYGLELQGMKPREAYSTARPYLELAGLQGFEESYPHELSGGMQQRANLARALVTHPDLLLLDEPLAALDAQTRELMQAELQRIWLRTQNTAIFVTHLISEAIYLADLVIVLSARPGRIKQILPIRFARPRPLHVKHQLDFHTLEDQIWELLQNEVKMNGVSSFTA